MNVRILPNNLQIKAEEELNEVPEKVEENIKYIREWLRKQPHLNVNPDDQFILTFLRGCKFNREITKQKIDYYYSTKTLIPEFFSDRDPLLPDIQQLFKNRRFWLPMPKFSDPLAPRLLINYGEPCKPYEKFNPVAVTKLILIIMDILLHEDDSFIVNGFYVIQHQNGASITHLAELTLSTLKNAVNCLFKRYPTRCKGVHVMDTQTIMKICYQLAKPFLSEKLRSRIIFHSTYDFSVLHSLFPKEELPIELGGQNYSMQTVLEEWKTKVEKHRNWLIEDENSRSDESKRIRKESRWKLF